MKEVLSIEYESYTGETVHRILNRINELNEQKYHNLDLIEFLEDVRIAVKQSGLNIDEKRCIYYFYELDKSIDFIGSEVLKSNKEVKSLLESARQKIARTFRSWTDKPKNEVKPLKESPKTYVVLDAETTGLEYQENQVTEIAAIKFAENGSEIGRFHTLVSLNEGQEYPQEVQKITGLSPFLLENGMVEYLALQCLDSFIGDSIVIAHHAAFDLSFLSRAKNHIPPTQFICTRTMAKLLEPNKSASLKAVCERFGINLSHHHSAMCDAEATKDLFKVLHRELDFKGYKEHFYTNLLISSDERQISYIPNEYTRVLKISDLVQPA